MESPKPVDRVDAPLLNDDTAIDMHPPMVPVESSPSSNNDGDLLTLRLNSKLSSLRGELVRKYSKRSKVRSVFTDLVMQLGITCKQARNLILCDSDNFILHMDRTLEQCGIVDGDSLYLLANERTFQEKWNDNVRMVMFCLVSMFLVLAYISVCTVGLELEWKVDKAEADAGKGRASGAERFGVVLDAGSVHTTLTVYKWPNIKLNGTGVVTEAFSCEGDATRGVSSFSYNPADVKNYLVKSPCYKQALSVVPAEVHQFTPIFLGATAGMRVLNSTAPVAASQIIGNISQALEKSPLNHTGPTAKIMTGEDEGVLGWVTSNYLSNTFHTEKNKSTSSHPLGALDWGGASSQITFVTSANSNRDMKQVSLFGRKYSLFTKSHLCYGQSEAISRYFVHLIHEAFKGGEGNNITEFTLKAPCQPKLFHSEGYNVTAKDLFYSPCTIYRDEHFQNAVERLPLDMNFTFIGQGNHKRCESLIKLSSFTYEHCMSTYKQPHCFNSADVPRPHPEVKFLAFSTYWYVLDALQTAASVSSTASAGLKSIAGTGRTEPRPFRSSVVDLCSKELLQEGLDPLGTEVRSNTCFRGIFMHLLLSDGYHFRESWNNIHFVKRVNDADVGWSLGHMILATNDIPEAKTWPDTTPGPTTETYKFAAVFFFALLGVLICMLLAFVLHSVFYGNRDSSKNERFVKKRINSRGG